MLRTKRMARFWCKMPLLLVWYDVSNSVRGGNYGAFTTTRYVGHGGGALLMWWCFLSSLRIPPCFSRGICIIVLWMSCLKTVGFLRHFRTHSVALSKMLPDAMSISGRQ